MTSNTVSRSHAVRLHLTNVAGTGATQLLQSLLPALESNREIRISAIHLPDRGALSHYVSTSRTTHVEVYRRYLPNALSRLLECTFFGYRFDGSEPLLVFGDLPLRCNAPQTVFVQTPHLLRPPVWKWNFDAIKFWISRAVFRLNLHRSQAFIVQTDVMRDALMATYPALRGRVHVIAQPVPSWLLMANLQRNQRAFSENCKLNLIYPAAGYPHKNHRLLADIPPCVSADWPVERLTLTLDNSQHPAPGVSWVQCAGFYSASQMIEAYRQVDALLFLSREESYGFPLVEAMFVGLPIVCPDLPYARTLCGDQAIYFDPSDVSSLREALFELKQRLLRGWWPEWSAQLEKIPSDWDIVARMMLKIAGGK